VFAAELLGSAAGTPFASRLRTGEAFMPIFRLRNTGTSTWSAGRVQLVHVAGQTFQPASARVSGVSSSSSSSSSAAAAGSHHQSLCLPLVADVAPGAEYSFALDLHVPVNTASLSELSVAAAGAAGVAPSETNHVGVWQLQQRSAISAESEMQLPQRFGDYCLVSVLVPQRVLPAPHKAGDVCGEEISELPQPLPVAVSQMNLNAVSSVKSSGYEQQRLQQQTRDRVQFEAEAILRQALQRQATREAQLMEAASAFNLSAQSPERVRALLRARGYDLQAVCNDLLEFR
jgi:hypothetical protein